MMYMYFLDYLRMYLYFSQVYHHVYVFFGLSPDDVFVFIGFSLSLTLSLLHKIAYSRSDGHGSWPSDLE